MSAAGLNSWGNCSWSLEESDSMLTSFDMQCVIYVWHTGLPTLEAGKLLRERLEKIKFEMKKSRKASRWLKNMKISSRVRISLFVVKCMCVIDECLYYWFWQKALWVELKTTWPVDQLALTLPVGKTVQLFSQLRSSWRSKKIFGKFS